MKKRTLSVLLAIALLVGMLPVGILSARAYSETDIPYAVEGGNIYFDKETGTITDCDDSVTAANIPAEIDGVAVTSIGVDAFYSCENLTSVTIPHSVTSIGNYAFEYCDSLTSVTIPDSVTSIGGYAFAYCDSLESVTIGNSVTSIGGSAFEGCDSLTSVTIPHSVTSIADGTFYNCSSLMSVTIPDSVTSIGSSAFAYCHSLKSVTIPDSVTSIGDSAFAYCDSLTSVTIGNSVTSIGPFAFEYCASLTSVTIPDSVTSIGIFAFESCESLTSVTIPDSVTSIGSYAFAYCDSLTSITIPDSVTSIGSSAFSCCSSLTSITIPDSVTSIGNCAFNYCHSLTGIWVDEANENYSSDENGVLFDKDKTTLIQCPGSYSGSYTIPDSVTSIGGSAFADCHSLMSVTIPDSVTSIGSWAFYFCASLTSVTIGNSVTSIGLSAFLGCCSLESVTIPDSVTSIGDSAFLLCGSLTGIWVEEANENYSSDENGVLFNKDKTDLIQCPGGYKGSYTIPDSVTSIGWSAFEGCDSLTGIWVDEANENYSSDENGVLFNKDKTTLIQCPGSYSGSYTIPDSVTSIDGYAFCDCNNLTGIFFLGDAPALGSHVFDYYDMETDTYQPIPGLTLYYTQGAEGWTTPTWYGYPTALWNPDGFVDVSADAWYADAVEYAVENGLFNGMSATTFEPETAMTRAMLVTVLWRYAGEPAEGENTFTDVPDGQWYTDAVAWAAHNSIVGGVGDNKFDPNGNITREQMATILYRYTSGQGIDTSARADLSGFPDAGNVSSYAKDPICWAVAEGLINGSDGKLLPQGNATRAQVATILMRFIENVAE